MYSRRDRAFTLVELLIVLAIIGTLIGLLLPAVQRIRDAAARTQCANNLRQIALAVHNHNDTVGSLPAGMRYRNGRDPYFLMSWLTQLLPFVEQDNLWRGTQAAYSQSTWPLNNPPHVGLATVLPLFVCPSDSLARDVAEAQREHISVAFTSYLGVEGRDLTTLDGVLFRDSRVRFTDITDGTSQTLLAGERPPSPDFQFGWWYAGAGQRFTGSADMILGVQERNVLPYAMVPCPQGVYTYGPGSIRNQCDMFHFWSFHVGGANFAFADGSVHFLPYSAVSVLPALASRSGGEVVTLP
jgi:prepilin-type N-terminal cleavage/methylation domain-containing protein/prepilin-type processing-associated H-X9-DG protein